MPNDLNDLEQKIQQAQENRAAKNSIQKGHNDGMQAGIEFVGSIVVGSAIGYGIDQWLNTAPFGFLIMFFMGVAAGFLSIYRISKNLGSSIGYSELHQRQKNANKTPELTTEVQEKKE